MVIKIYPLIDPNFYFIYQFNFIFNSNKKIKKEVFL
jgi:hypothetical protein